MTGQSVPLGELLRVQHGWAFKGQHFNNSGTELVLTPGNFRIGGGIQVRPGKERFYSGPYPAEFSLRAGDLLVAMTDLTQGAPILGSPLVVPASGQYLHNQRLGKVVSIDEERLDRAYAYYLFVWDGTRAQLRASATGSTVRHTAPERIYRVSIPLPSVHAQRKIATILSAYDDLIENNHRRSKILEDMAQRLYGEWFTHFRYPGHASVPIIDSELGAIPNGWVWEPASRVLSINPKMLVDRATSHPFIPMASLSENGMHVQRIAERVGVGGARFANGDTLFARITPCLENGKTAFVQGLAEGAVATGSTEFIVLRSRKLSPELTYLLARDERFRSNAIKSMSGATGRQRVRDECFDSFMVPTAPPDVIAAFSELVRPMFSLSFNLHCATQRLRSTRDLLIPRLISGEIDVESLDIEVPAVAA